MASERFEIVVTSKGTRTVKRDFDSVANSAERTGKATERTGRTIDTSMRRGGAAVRRTGADYRRLQGDIRRTGQVSTATAGRVRALTRSLAVPAATNASLLSAQRNVRGLLGAFSAFYAVRYIGEAADSFTRMNNALKGFGVGARSIDRVRKGILAVSNDARVDAEQATVLFGRLRLATRDLGTSEQDVLQLTGTINKALRLSGSSALEASQSIRQLSQAFNKGKLDGDEFRSVLENAPILTKLLSKELGISKRQLRDWAEQGKISVAALARTLKSGRGEIEDLFGRLTPTIGDSFKILKNNLVEFIGTESAFSASARIFSNALLLIGENLGTILGLLQAIAAVKIGKSLLNFAKALGAGRALGALASGLAPAAAGAPLAGAPVVGSAAVTTATVAALTASNRKVKTLDEAFGKTNQKTGKLNRSLKETVVITGGNLKNAVKGVFDIISKVGRAAFSLRAVFAAVAVAAVAVGTKIGSGVVGRLKEVTGETSSWKAVTVALAAAWDRFSASMSGAIDGVYEGVKMIMDAIIHLLNKTYGIALGMVTTAGFLIEDPGAIFDSKKLGEYQDLGRKAQKAYMDGVKDGTRGIGQSLEEVGDNISKGLADYIKPGLAKSDYDQAVAPLYATLDELQDRVDSLGIGDRLAAGLGVTGDQLKEISKTSPNAGIDSFSATARKAIADATAEGKDIGAILQAADSLREYTTALEEIKSAFPATADEALKAVDRFQDFGDQPTDIAELNSVRDAATALNGYLKETLGAFNGLEEAIRVAEGAEGIEGVQRALDEVKGKVDTAAEKLPPPIAAAAREAAAQMITETQAVLTQGAADIAVAVKAAFLNALVPGLSSVAGQLTQPGTEGPGGIGTSTTLNFDDTSSQIKKNADSVRELNQALSETQRRLQDYDVRSNAAFRSAGNNAKNAAGDIQQFFEGAFSSLEDALVGFVTTGKLDFKSLINSIIADLARMVIRMLIIKPLMGFFGGLFGFAGGGIVPGFKNGGVIPAYAGGGIIGGFGGARRDNQLIAASPGEMIVNAGATAANQEELQYINKTGKMPPGGGSGGTTVFAPNITINESGNDPQLTAQMVDAAVKRSWTELGVKSQRKGGIFDR